jgi:hypothetical protein
MRNQMLESMPANALATRTAAVAAEGADLAAKIVRTAATF